MPSGNGAFSPGPPRNARIRPTAPSRPHRPPMHAEPAPSRQTRATGGTLAFVLLLAALGTIGYWMLFSHFAGYDDEGYILISAREYFARGQLYEQVYSQYGPAYYVLM